MRLIDADKLKADFIGKRYGVQAIEYVIDQQPTVDAVEVVRCRDCVYCKRFNDVWYMPKRDELLCTLYVETYHTTENDYCSHGERKDETG